MCGICGEFLYRGQQSSVEPSQISAMAAALAHRGPDDEGAYLSPTGCFGMGFRRLSIVDLAGGSQPMCNEDSRVWVAFNGEIYNHLELRVDLEQRGHRFRTRADTEVLVHLYEEEGAELVQRLRGMFAFAIWDERERSLVLARDRLGVKPLYYSLAGGRLLFASEIKALLRHASVAARLDETALYDYLSFATTPAPSTLFEGILKLPPAHRLLARDGEEPHLERYWDPLRAAPSAGSTLSEHEYVERLRSLLTESIRLRMMSDVPFGVFLSGGLDSSLNVALMSQMMDRPVDTFSVAIEGQQEFDELNHARRVAQAFGANHHEVVIGEREFLDALPSVVYHQDEPLADPVCVPLYYLAQLARRSGTIVVQVGEGSDELFCGYRGYVQFLQFHRRYWRPFAALPSSFRRTAYAAAGGALALMKRDFLRRGAEGEELFWGGAVAFWELEKQALMGSVANHRSSRAVLEPIYARYDAQRPDAKQMERMIHLELQLRLPELLLMRVDKMTMAHSVEARVPYLDHKLVEFALTIPPALKLRGNTTKYILKQAARGLVPEEVISRSKMGFCGSASNMLTPNLLRQAEQDVLSSPLVRERFNLPFVGQLFASALAGDADHHFKLWNLWNLALWHRAWIERSMPAPPGVVGAHA